MSAELFGVVYLVIGIILLVWGARVAHLVLGLWGLGFGLWLGNALFSSYNLSFPWEFISTWGMGLLFMVLTYSFYKFALAVLIGMTSFWITAGLLNLTQFDDNLVLLLSITAGVIAGIFTLRSVLPHFILMLVTAIIGAGYTICGVLILVDNANLANIGYSPLGFVFRQPTIWTVALIVLAIVGVATQDTPSKKQITE